MPEKFAGPQGNSSDFLKVLLALEAKTMRDTHVATIAKIVELGTTTHRCVVIPTLKDESEKFIYAYYLEDITLNVDDVVLILFTDRNFTQNLRQIDYNQKLSLLDSQSELHSQSYGIIIGKLRSVQQWTSK